jgi:hypothetical protein
MTTTKFFTQMRRNGLGVAIATEHAKAAKTFRRTGKHSRKVVNLQRALNRLEAKAARKAEEAS